MPPQGPDREFKRQLYRRLDPYPREPIDSNGPLYVPLYEGQHDPIAQIEEKIDLSGLDSLQFLSGCRGSGKTTELHRLRLRLENSNYIAFHANALEYLNPAEPVEINQLLVVLAAAFSEQVADKIAKDPARQGYLTRFWNFLANTNVTFEEFSLNAGVPGFETEFKATLRTTDSFRQKIGQALAGRTQELKNQVDNFIRDAVQWLQEDRPGTAGIVFLFDSLEQLRGSTSNESEVMASVERLFTQNRELLRIKEVHVVYTVPPWLRYRAPGAVPLEKMLPCVKLWQYDGGSKDRNPCLHGWSIMRELITRRVGEDRMSDVFGPPDENGNYARLDQLIRFCGGHFRDLLFLVSEGLVVANQITISDDDIERAVSNLRAQFPLAENDASWLQEIYETRLPCLPDNNPDTVGRFTRFLDNHLVLLFGNGREWYDVHPIILEDVLSLYVRLQAKVSSDKPKDSAGTPGA
jgi:hypothetical protein